MMIEVVKYCSCGVKLEREANDEEPARQLVIIFRLEHSGVGHGPTDHSGYLRAFSQLVASRFPNSKKARKTMPLLAEIERAGTDALDLHVWANRFGLEVCQVCLIVKPDFGRLPQCKPIQALVLYQKG